MAATARCEIDLLGERRLDTEIDEKLFGQDLINLATSHLKLRDSELFGLSWEDDDGHVHWLLHDKLVLNQVTEHCIQTNCGGSGEDTTKIVLYLIVKFYVPTIALLNDAATVEAFFMQAKLLMSRGMLEPDSQTEYRLSALALQANFGDWTNDSDAKLRLRQMGFPSSLLTKHKSVNYCERKILEDYKGFIGFSRGNAVIQYMNTVEGLATYGIHFYKVRQRDRDGPMILIGLSHRGLSEYDINNRKVPKKFYQWKYMENIYCRNSKFTVEINNPKTSTSSGSVSIIVYYAFTNALNKTIWSTAISQHQFHMDHRRGRKPTPEDFLRLQRIGRELNNPSQMMIRSSLSRIALAYEARDDDKSTPEIRLSRLSAKKSALVEILRKKLKELQEICKKEAELTGEPLDPEMPTENDIINPTLRKLKPSTDSNSNEVNHLSSTSILNAFTAAPTESPPERLPRVPSILKIPQGGHFAQPLMARPLQNFPNRQAEQYRQQHAAPQEPISISTHSGRRDLPPVPALSSASYSGDRLKARSPLSSISTVCCDQTDSTTSSNTTTALSNHNFSSNSEATLSVADASSKSTSIMLDSSQAFFERPRANTLGRDFGRRVAAGLSGRSGRLSVGQNEIEPSLLSPRSSLSDSSSTSPTPVSFLPPSSLSHGSAAYSAPSSPKSWLRLDRFNVRPDIGNNSAVSLGSSGVAGSNVSRYIPSLAQQSTFTSYRRTHYSPLYRSTSPIDLGPTSPASQSQRHQQYEQYRVNQCQPTQQQNEQSYEKDHDTHPTQENSRLKDCSYESCFQQYEKQQRGMFASSLHQSSDTVLNEKARRVPSPMLETRSKYETALESANVYSVRTQRLSQAFSSHDNIPLLLKQHSPPSSPLPASTDHSSKMPTSSGRPRSPEASASLPSSFDSKASTQKTTAFSASCSEADTENSRFLVPGTLPVAIAQRPASSSSHPAHSRQNSLLNASFNATVTGSHSFAKSTSLPASTTSIATCSPFTSALAPPPPPSQPKPKKDWVETNLDQLSFPSGSRRSPIPALSLPPLPPSSQLSALESGVCSPGAQSRSSPPPPPPTLPRSAHPALLLAQPPPRPSKLPPPPPPLPLSVLPVTPAQVHSHKVPPALPMRAADCVSGVTGAIATATCGASIQMAQPQNHSHQLTAMRAINGALHSPTTISGTQVVLEPGKFKPYYEESKPFEMADFYKYSQKHRKN